MHNSHQSFASRQRMLNYDGSASNQVIWFTDARPARVFDQTPMALQVMDEWMANIHSKPWRGVSRNKPAAAVDSCFATDGSLIYSGRDAWNGILDSKPAGPCTQVFPTPLDVPDRGRRADRGRRLQVRAASRSRGRSPTGRTAPGSRAPTDDGSPPADLPDRRLRLHEARRGSPEGPLDKIRRGRRFRAAPACESSGAGSFSWCAVPAPSAQPGCTTGPA